ncbi:hypothetical protein BH18ACT12_BH18ACT12_17580 [soil metagenome]
MAEAAPHSTAHLSRQLRHLPVRGRGDDRVDRRLARSTDARRPCRGGGAGRGGRATARPARPARRTAGSGETVCAGARIVARARSGVRRFHSGATRPRRLRPGDDRARRRRAGRGDGCRRARHRRCVPTGLCAPREGIGARGGAERQARLPPDDGRRALSGRSRPPRAGAEQPGAGSIAGRPAPDRDAGARARGAGRVLAGGRQAHRAPRPARRNGGAEHPQLRGRTKRGRRAAEAVGAARRLRVCGLARVAEPDGGGHRCRAYAAGALAGVDRRPAAVVPRVDRRRDVAPRESDRRRPGHVANRSGDVQLHLQRRRPGGVAAQCRGGCGAGARRGPRHHRGRQRASLCARRSCACVR